MPKHEHHVAMLADIPDAGMRAVTVDGTDILLLRHGDMIVAIGATCPHAGGPLAEGVRHGDRIICPWHKASFCIPTGALADPPAVDPLPRYAVRVVGERVLLTLPSQPQRWPQMASDARCFVIVGAGAAGALAAQTLRQEGFGGRIVMMDDKNKVPYDRTVLSKSFLSGSGGGEKSPLQSESFYLQHQIERRAATVTELDARDRRIACADGSSLRYDTALLATGGVPRRPSLPGGDLGNVFVLRSRADADALLAQAERSEHAAVLGAGFIGLEVAASLRERGLQVTVVGRENAPLEKRLGATVGNAFAALHRRQKVAFRLGCTVAALEGGPDVRGVRLGNGDFIAADLVVMGFGVTPATGFIRGVTLNDDGGVPVDAHLRAADGLYAAGDIASFPLRGDGAAIRVEHWRVAEQQGRIAAMNMLGRSVRYDAVPVFWTIQYMRTLDYIGHATSWDEIVVHGDLEEGKFLAYYVKDGVVAAAAGMDRDKDTAALIALMSLRPDWTATALGNDPVGVLAGVA